MLDAGSTAADAAVTVVCAETIVFVDACRQVLVEHAKFIIDQLKKGINGIDICREIKACTTATGMYTHAYMIMDTAGHLEYRNVSDGDYVSLKMPRVSRHAILDAGVNPVPQQQLVQEDFTMNKLNELFLDNPNVEQQEAMLKLLASWGLIANRQMCENPNCNQSPMSFVKAPTAIDGFEWRCNECRYATSR